MIRDLNYLLPEIKKIYPYIDSLRKNNGSIEFAFKLSNGEFSWFNYCQLPEKAMVYIQKLKQLGEI